MFLNLLASFAAPRTQTFVYVSDGDTNGIFYFLGTDFGMAGWANPHTAGRCVIVRSSDGNAANEGSKYVNRATDDTYTDNLSNSWVAADLGAQHFLVLTKYTLQNRNFADRAIRNWKVQGSNNSASNSIADLAAATWVDIDSRVGDTTMAANVNQFASYDVSGAPLGYRWIRVLQNGVNSGGDDYLTLAELEFYGEFTF